MRLIEVVEHACSIPTLQMGEFAEGVASDMDCFTLRQPLGVTAGICPFVQIKSLVSNYIEFSRNDSAVDVSHGHCMWKHVNYQALGT
jgi:hypothetical protein